MKILLIKFRHIGDVLLSTPLIENLKKQYPDATIDFALNQECADMLSGSPFIHQLITYDRHRIKKLNFISRIVEEIKFTARIRSQHYDLVINLTEGDRGAQLAFFSGAGLKLGFPVRKGVFSKLKIFDRLANDQIEHHTVEKDLQFIPLLDKTIVNKRVSVFWPSRIEQEVDEQLQRLKINKFVHIHPVSRWMFKCWEDDRMAAVIDYIQDQGIAVIITGAPVSKEQDRIDNIMRLCKTQPIDLSGQLSLKHLPCLSSKAAFFFGVDTAPMHLAAAVNTPVIALFGASKVQCWGPWDNHMAGHTYQPIRGIQKNGIHTVLSHTNFSIFYLKGVKKCQGMMEIKLDDVRKVIDSQINQLLS